MDEQTQQVIYERTGPDGALALVTINRPEALGALSIAAKEELLAALVAASAEPGVRAVVLGSRGRAFCVGQDLRELKDAYASPTPPDLGEVVRRYYNPIVQTIVDMPKPVIAAINGPVAGAGLGIALACDLRWAARSAVFATAFTGIGLAGDSGITWHLNRLIGPAKTAALMYLNERITADGALELGLVNAVVDDELLESSAQELACGLPPARRAPSPPSSRPCCMRPPTPSQNHSSSKRCCRKCGARRQTTSARSRRSSPRPSRPLMGPKGLPGGARSAGRPIGRSV